MFADIILPLNLPQLLTYGVPHEMQDWLRPEILEAVRKLKPLAEDAGCSLSQFSLAWVLREPNVASAIVGASRPDQLDENAAASGLEVDPALFAQAEAIVAKVERVR